MNVSERTSLWVLFWFFVMVFTVAFLLIDCKPRPAMVAPTLTITSDACESLARLYDRPDVAEICQTAKDLAPLVDKLLSEAHLAGCQADGGAK